MITQLDREKSSTLPYEIIDYISGYKDSLHQGTTLQTETDNFLKSFNGYDFNADVIDRGSEVISVELGKIEGLVSSEEFEEAIRGGIAIAQQTNPSVAIERIKIYLIFAGKKTDARSFNGGIIFNLANLVNKQLQYDEMLERVRSMTAHETLHQFIRQLGLKPESYPSVEDEILHDIWEEGLTTTIETDHHLWHQAFVDDGDFWIESIKKWLRARNDNHIREEILLDCYQRLSYKDSLDKEGKKFRELSTDPSSIDQKFKKLLFYSNGPGYHVGYLLWKRALDRGENITELLMKGDSQVRDWLDLEV